jgi:hypothetical protein
MEEGLPRTQVLLWVAGEQLRAWKKGACIERVKAKETEDI